MYLFIMDVLPTDWSPRNTSLYLVTGYVILLAIQFKSNIDNTYNVNNTHHNTIINTQHHTIINNPIIYKL